MLDVSFVTVSRWERLVKTKGPHGPALVFLSALLDAVECDPDLPDQLKKWVDMGFPHRTAIWSVVFQNAHDMREGLADAPTTD